MHEKQERGEGVGGQVLENFAVCDFGTVTNENDARSGNKVECTT